MAEREIPGNIYSKKERQDAQTFNFGISYGSTDIFKRVGLERERVVPETFFEGIGKKLNEQIDKALYEVINFDTMTSTEYVSANAKPFTEEDLQKLRDLASRVEEDRLKLVKKLAQVMFNTGLIEPTELQIQMARDFWNRWFRDL